MKYSRINYFSRLNFQREGKYSKVHLSCQSLHYMCTEITAKLFKNLTDLISLTSPELFQREPKAQTQNPPLK